MDPNLLDAFLAKTDEVLSEIESKRVVRDPQYWGAPYGATIVPGMRSSAQTVKSAHTCIHAADLDNPFVVANLREVMSIPAPVLDAYASQGGRIELFAGTMTAHPDNKNLRGVTPRGWPDRYSWDDVQACGPSGKGTPVYIGTDGVGTGSVSVVLHEMGHGLDTYLSDGTQWLSDSPAIKSAYARVNWSLPYYQQEGAAGRQEAFAEAFASLSSGEYHDDFRDPEGQQFVETVAQVIEIAATRIVGAP